MKDQADKPMFGGFFSTSKTCPKVEDSKIGNMQEKKSKN